MAKSEVPTQLDKAVDEQNLAFDFCVRHVAAREEIDKISKFSDLQPNDVDEELKSKKDALAKLHDEYGQLKYEEASLEKEIKTSTEENSKLQSYVGAENHEHSARLQRYVQDEAEFREMMGMIHSPANALVATAAWKLQESELAKALAARGVVVTDKGINLEDTIRSLFAQIEPAEVAAHETSQASGKHKNMSNDAESHAAKLQDELDDAAKKYEMTKKQEDKLDDEVLQLRKELQEQKAAADLVRIDAMTQAERLQESKEQERALRLRKQELLYEHLTLKARLEESVSEADVEKLRYKNS